MRQSILSIVMVITMICGAAALHAKQKAVTVFTVTPQMHCQNCENKIKSNLRFEKGVSEIVTDLENQTVSVSYDADKTDVSKLQKALGRIGYEATETKPAKSCGGCKSDGKQSSCDSGNSCCKESKK